MNIEEYRDNPKTKYLFSEYDRLVKEIQETKDLLAADPCLKNMAESEIKYL